LPLLDADGILTPEPVAILQTRSQQLRARTITQVLVHWQCESKENATWESLYLL